MPFKYAKIIFCWVGAAVTLATFSLPASGSSTHTQVHFDGDKFSEMKAMEAFFQNAHVRQEDEIWTIIAPNIDFSAVFSKWDNEQYCSAEDIKKYSLLSDGEAESFLSDLAWKNDIRAWQELPFRVKGTQKVYLVTQSATCSARSCCAVIGVLLWTKDKTGWQLETAAPCLTGMGDNSSYHGEVSIVQIGPANYGILFKDNEIYNDFEISELVIIDEQGSLRVAFNEVSGDGNMNVSTVIADKIPPAERYKYTSEIDFVPGKNKVYWDMIVHYQGTRQKNENGEYGKVQAVVPYNLKKRFVYANGRYIRRKK